ncbi:MAG: hypothetical protein Q9181_008288 [Wetmoreana brouardii]
MERGHFEKYTEKLRQRERKALRRADEEDRSSRVRKGNVLTASVKAINDLRRQEKD